MAIEFTLVNKQKVSFGHLSRLEGLYQKTIVFEAIWDTLTAEAYAHYVMSNYGSGLGDEGFAVAAAHAVANRLAYAEAWSDGPWYSGNWEVPISVSTNYVVIITYDRTNIANDPIFYLNNVETASSQITAPAGTPVTGINNAFSLGDPTPSADTNSTDGKIKNVAIYNRIISAGERAIVTANSAVKLAGCVFYSKLNKATGMPVFDGSALAAGNTVLDEQSGTLGVPNLSPLGIYGADPKRGGVLFQADGRLATL